jgi:hypothetical protein
MSEAKFEIGDIVRRKQDHTIFAGWIGEVVKVNDDEISVKYKRHTWSSWSKAKNYELVERKSECFCFESKAEPATAVKEAESPQSKFKVGDRVRVAEDPDFGPNAGIAGQVVKCETEIALVKLESPGSARTWFSVKHLEPAPAASECLTTDNVNHPPHYNQGGIECLEAIKAALGDGFADYLRGNVMKYLWRCEHKGGVEDLKKAAWYLDRAIKEMEVSGE